MGWQKILILAVILGTASTGCVRNLGSSPGYEPHSFMFPGLLSDTPRNNSPLDWDRRHAPKEVLATEAGDLKAYNEALELAIKDKDKEIVECNNLQEEKVNLKREIALFADKMRWEYPQGWEMNVPPPPLRFPKLDSKPIDIAGYIVQANERNLLWRDEAMRMEKYDLYREMVALQFNNRSLHRILRDKEAEAETCARESVYFLPEIAALRAKLDQLKAKRAELIMLALRDPVLPKEEPKAEKPKTAPPAPVPQAMIAPLPLPPPLKQEEAMRVEPEKPKEAPKAVAARKPAPKKRGPLRVQVMSSKEDALKKTADKVAAMGYKVVATDLAGAGSTTTVYYAQGYVSEAGRVAKNLGGGAVAKPRTWYAPYPLTVVPGA
jgi:hypothetical protein